MSTFESANGSGEKQTSTATIGTQISMWNPTEIAEFYKKYVDRYDMEIDSNAAEYPGPFIIGDWVLQYLLALLKSEGSSCKTVNILDLGCGTGQSGLAFLKHEYSTGEDTTFNLVGIDATPEMLAKAKTRGYNVTLVHDLECQPYPSELVPVESFDAVICVGVMDFIRNPIKFLHYIQRFFRSNGTGGKKKGVLGITLPERHSHSDLSSFTVGEMENLLLKQGGFSEIIRHERFMGYRDSVTGNIQYYHGWLCIP